VLPIVAARDLDNDPERLSLVALDLLRYEEAFQVYKRADAKETEKWQNNRMFKLVERNTLIADGTDPELLDPEEES
jgi:hypothetical protein